METWYISANQQKHFMIVLKCLENILNSIVLFSSSSASDMHKALITLQFGVQFVVSSAVGKIQLDQILQRKKKLSDDQIT